MCDMRRTSIISVSRTEALTMQQKKKVVMVIMEAQSGDN